MVFNDSLGGGHCGSQVFACYQILTDSDHNLLWEYGRHMDWLSAVCKSIGHHVQKDLL